jgi:hypothetical protein
MEINLPDEDLVPCLEPFDYLKQSNNHICCKSLTIAVQHYCHLGIHYAI